ncbi:PBP1A family penicillin-binding protein [bacterium]|nr:PBP1A family penicillin-binding protein [bacterium]
MQDDFSKPDPASTHPPDQRRAETSNAKYRFPAKPALSFWTWKRILILCFFVIFSAGTGIGLGILFTYLGEIPLVSDLKAYKPSLSTKIFDAKGRKITELFSEKRTLVGLDDIPLHLQNAILAIEDKNFYHHFGVDFSDVVRSSIVNLMSGTYRQGFSTITMQLPRNMFLTKKKTLERKIKEIILAFQIEQTYTKREILEMYLNQIYLGSGAYGVEAAALKYFGKHIADLTLPECALIAGLPRAPNRYNPYRNPDKALQRRNLVLSQMHRLDYITMDEMIEAKLSLIELSSVQDIIAPYFIEHVRRQLEDRYGSNAIYKSGLKVYTTLDIDLQKMAQTAMADGILEAEAFIKPRMQVVAGQEPETIQCALVLIEPSSGEIKAFIGGRDFKKSKFNRAIQAQRQPGSAFKPFIYATAFEHGFTQADIILDTPVVFKDDNGNVWKPENFSNKFRGPTTLRTALTKSRNVIAVKLLDKVGIRNVIALATTLGIKSPLKPYLTLALGASEINLLELVSAYGCFPNRGIHVDPFSIRKVENDNGEILEETTPYQQEVLNPVTAALMTNLLENVVNRGTGYTVRRLGFKYPAGGKTGTTNDYTDAWFLGFTSEYVGGVWIGLDSHNSMGRGTTGGKVASPIWTRLFLSIYENRAPKNFVYPESVELTRFCNQSGLLPNPGCKQHLSQGAFAIGTAPTEHCDIHINGGAQELLLPPDLADVPAAPTGNAQPDAGSGAPSHPGIQPTPQIIDPDRPLMF